MTQCDRRVRSGHRLPDECNGLERGTARRHEGYPTLSLDETRDVRAAIESVLQVDPIALNRDSHRTPQKASEDNQSADGTKDQGSSVIHARQSGRSPRVRFARDSRPRTGHARQGSGRASAPTGLRNRRSDTAARNDSCPGHAVVTDCSGRTRLRDHSGAFTLARNGC